MKKPQPGSSYRWAKPKTPKGRYATVMPNDANIAEQVRVVHAVGGLHVRGDRALIELTGADRAAWLNNLVTNVIKTLQPGEGNYAFATNIKGRVVFDMNMLVLADRIWLDVDARQIDAALSHLDRYIITEDVKLVNISEATTRVAVMGSGAAEGAARLGLGNFMAMAQLQHVECTINGAPARIIRHDFAGLPAAEFIVVGGRKTVCEKLVRESILAPPIAGIPSRGTGLTPGLVPSHTSSNEEAVAQIERIAGELGLAKINSETVNILRIEAGIPQSVDDIDDDVVPPETGQIERGISYQKGCYLGQEVIERMRSHGILARKLVGVRIDGAELPPRGSAMKIGEQEVGRITSCCWSEALHSVLALGYVKTAHAKPETAVLVDDPQGERAARIISLPVSREAA